MAEEEGGGPRWENGHSQLGSRRPRQWPHPDARGRSHLSRGVWPGQQGPAGPALREPLGKLRLHRNPGVQGRLKLGAARPTTEPQEGDRLLPSVCPPPQCRGGAEVPEEPRARRAPTPPPSGAVRARRPLMTPRLPQPRPRRAHASQCLMGADPGAGSPKLPCRPLQGEGTALGASRALTCSRKGRRGGEHHKPHGRDEAPGSLGERRRIEPSPISSAFKLRAGAAHVSPLPPPGPAPSISRPRPPRLSSPPKPQGTGTRCCSPVPTPVQSSHFPRG